MLPFCLVATPAPNYAHHARAPPPMYVTRTNKSKRFSTAITASAISSVAPSSSAAICVAPTATEDHLARLASRLAWLHVLTRNTLAHAVLWIPAAKAVSGVVHTKVNVICRAGCLVTVCLVTRDVRNGCLADTSVLPSVARSVLRQSSVLSVRIPGQ